MLEMGGEPERQGEVLSLRCPFRCPLPLGPASWVISAAAQGRGSRLPPTPWSGPWQGASSGRMHCYWVEESRAPHLRMHRAGAAADVPRDWRCPYTCLCLYNPPGISKFTERKWNQPGVKRRTNLFDLGEFHPKDHLPLS